MKYKYNNKSWRSLWILLKSIKFHSEFRWRSDLAPLEKPTCSYLVLFGDYNRSVPALQDFIPGAQKAHTQILNTLFPSLCLAEFKVRLKEV